MKHTEHSITVCILTHRSDSLFLQSLESSQFAPEVLILDHASNNDWQALAKRFRFTVKKLDSTSISNFGAVRNLALEVVTTDWIFFLDSDESVSPNQAAVLLTLLDNPKAAGYTITRNDTFLGQPIRHAEGTIRLTRLMRKKRAKFVGKVHEKPTISGGVFHSSVHIAHHPHISITSFINKVSWYSRLAAAEKQSSAAQNFLELLWYPLGKFTYNYFVRAGWRDGWAGLSYCYIMSLHSLFVRINWYEKNIVQN